MDSNYKWYRGNLHAHTTHSDGHKSPEDIVAIYKQGGYDFMALTDHDFFTDYHSQLGSEDFLILPAMEGSIYYITAPEKVAKYKDANLTDTWEILFDVDKHPNCDKAHHFNVYQSTGDAPFAHGTFLPPQVVFGTEGHREALQKTVDFYREKGCFVIYNHPLWSRIAPDDILGITGLNAIEVYNHMTEEACGLGADSTYLDILLRSGTPINVMAADDNHNKGDVDDNYGGYVMVKAPELSQRAIMTALEAGQYYASSGATLLDWGVKDNQVYVTCEPASKIVFVVGGKITDGGVAHSKDGTLTHATYALKGHETYVRIECTNADGKKAWTNPIYFHH